MSSGGTCSASSSVIILKYFEIITVFVIIIIPRLPRVVRLG